MNKILKTYARDDEIGETNAEMMPSTQLSNKLPIEYT